MPIPSRQDIVTAVKNLSIFALIPELKNVVIETNAMRQPFCKVGGFNMVFKYNDTAGKMHGLRINFTGNLDAAFNRAAQVANYLKQVNLPYFVNFIYHAKALLINENEWSTIIMDWQDGILLKDYIQDNLTKPKLIAQLAADFKAMTAALHSKNLAHGDLQHGNIMINSAGKIKLLDYDSLVIPELVGQPELITGLRDYQHPSRFNNNRTCQLSVDYFWELVIYISIVALSRKPALFETYNVAKTEGLLFKSIDFVNFEQTAIYKELKAIDDEIAVLLQILGLYLVQKTLDNWVYWDDLVKLLQTPDVKELIKFLTQDNVYKQQTNKQATSLNENWWTKKKNDLSVSYETENSATENNIDSILDIPFTAMVYVEGGTFMMGATAEQGSDAFDDEKPAHQVSLSSYYIGKYQVTQGLWNRVMGSNPSRFKGENLPVEKVSWEDCQEFIRKLNQMTGKKYRLPTEAEWEYAARGGSRGVSHTPFKYSGSNDIDAVAWYRDNSGDKTHAVGQKRANELGIYDMSGNVWEWCSDWYGSYSSSAVTNPTGAISGLNRVFRGGGWYYFRCFCRVSGRINDPPSNRNDYLGLRLVLVL